MQTINITIRSRIAIADADAKLICNNEDYQVAFDFDEEWAAVDQKILRVRYSNTYQEVIFTGDSCIVPAPDNVEYAEIGVYGGGMATTAAYIPCDKSIICPNAQSKIPHTAYQQLLSYYEEIIERTKNVVESTDAANEAASAANAAKEATNSATARALEAAAKYEDAAPVIELAASGEVVAVHDSAERPIRGLTLYGKSTQDGTPTINAPVDIASVGDNGSVGIKVYGKNLCNLPDMAETEINGIKWSYKDGTVTAHGVTTAQSYVPPSTCTLDLAPGTYTVSGGKDNVLIIVTRKRGTESAWFTSRDGEAAVFDVLAGDVVYLYAQVSNGNSVSSVTVYPMVNVGEIPLAYEPYKEMQSMAIDTPNGLPGIPVSSGGNYTDADGQQWISDEVDLARGVYIKRLYDEVYDGSTDERWNKGSESYFHLIKESMSQKSKANGCALSTRFRFSSGSLGEAGLFKIGNAYGPMIRVADSVTDVDMLRTWLAANTVRILYELETPIETALSAEEIAAFLALNTKVPHTTVLNDAGAGMAVKYAADTKTYIDNKIMALLNT